VTHLLCVGGLEALCCKGCSVVGLCGDGVVCECEFVCAWGFAVWDYCGGVVPFVGGGCGHDRNFPEIFGARDKLF